MALDALRSAFRRPPVETPPFAAPPATGAVPMAVDTAPPVAPAPPAADPPPSAYQPDQFRPVPADPIAGAGVDAGAHPCPSCGRTLASGTRRCADCGTRLVMDVPVRRAGLLAGVGALAGVLVTLLAVNVLAPARPLGAASAGDVPAASGAVADPGRSPGMDVSVGAAAALRGTTAINGRLAAEATALSKAVSTKPFQTGDVVKILRRMAIDTRAGAGMVAPLADWPAAARQQADLESFYATLEDRIDAGLGASVQSAGAYRKAAKQVLKSLAKIPGLDAEARTLAATAAIELPDVTIPKVLR